jgi:hypothetical protein
MQGKKALAWHILVVEINVYISSMAYTRIPNIPLAGTEQIEGNLTVFSIDADAFRTFERDRHNALA